MALLDKMGGGGGSMGQPEWVKGILSKRHMAPAATSTAAGAPTSIMGQLVAHPFFQQGGGLSPFMNIFNKLGFGGAPGGASAPGTTPAPTRPAPFQFDPSAYLTARLGPGPWAKPPGTPW